MVNEEVLGALRSALQRGEPLNRAIRTLRNAKYKREDIDEAASIASDENIQPVVQQVPKDNFPKFLAPKDSETPTAPQPNQNPIQTIKKKLFQKLPQPEKQTQKVSNYDETKPKKKNKLIPILIFVLFFIAIVLTTLFFFKDEIFSFINKLF